MGCPNCHNEDVEMERKNDDGQGFYEEEDYVCNKCGCEWTWKMEKEITKQGKNIDENED